MVYKHILIASGGAEHSRRAERRAVDMATAHGAKLSLLSVVRLETFPVTSYGLEMGTTINYTELLEEQQKHQAEVLADACIRCEQRGLKPDPLLRGGNAGKQIIATAKELGCDLIVVGSRKLSMVSALALGSVSDYVMRHAEADVLIAH